MTHPHLLSAAVGILVAVVLGHRALARALAPRRAARRAVPPLPSLTVIRPIKGLDAGARGNLEALFASEYPASLEVLLVLDDAADPAFELAAEAVRRHCEHGCNARLLLAGRPPAGRTGKLHAMIRGSERAVGELLAFSDSDTRPAPGLLRRLAEELLSRPDAGAVFAPVAAVPAGRPSPGDVGYALLVNAWYGAAAARAAGEHGVLPFIMGQLMVLRREALGAIGGLRCAEGHLVDDMRIGLCMSEAGFANVQVREPLHVVAGGMSPRAFASLVRRWMRFGTGGLSARFRAVPWAAGIAFASAWVCAGAAVALRDPLAGAVSAAAIVAFAAAELDLSRRRGGASVPARLLWVPIVLPFVAAALALANVFSTSVEWRGRSYPVDRRARLPFLVPRAAR